MERPSNLNGHTRGVVLEKELITDANTLENARSVQTVVLTPDRKTAAVVTPLADLETEEPTPTLLLQVLDEWDAKLWKSGNGFNRGNL